MAQLVENNHQQLHPKGSGEGSNLSFADLSHGKQENTAAILVQEEGSHAKTMPLQQQNFVSQPGPRLDRNDE